MNPIVNSAAVATYHKLPRKAQYITILIAGIAMAAYAGYRLSKKAKNKLSSDSI